MGLIIDSFCGGGGASTGIRMTEPLGAATAVNKSALVEAFLIKYYGQGTGQSIHRPLGTITSKDRFGLVVVGGEEYQIVDIGMRMLTPRELFRAQGFPEDYIIDRDYTGKPYSKAKQTERVGNSVCPDIARALVEANMNAEAARKEA